jgi:hypothetical protein
MENNEEYLLNQMMYQEIHQIFRFLDSRSIRDFNEVIILKSDQTMAVDYLALKPKNVRLVSTIIERSKQNELPDWKALVSEGYQLIIQALFNLAHMNHKRAIFYGNTRPDRLYMDQEAGGYFD